MSKNIKYTDEFKKDAISQVINRGYSVSEVSSRLGMSAKTLYRWVKEHKKPKPQVFHETKLSKENRAMAIWTKVQCALILIFPFEKSVIN